MTFISTDFETPIRGPWELARGFLVEQLQLLQAELAPLVTLANSLRTTTDTLSANTIVGLTGYPASSILTTTSASVPGFSALQPCPLAFVASAIISPTALAANTNDYAPTSLTSAAVLRVSATGPVNVTGLTAATTHRLVLLVNIGANTITLTHADALSAAANRWRCPGAANLALTTDKAVWIYYDLTSAVWQVVG